MIYITELKETRHKILLGIIEMEIIPSVGIKKIFSIKAFQEKKKALEFDFLGGHLEALISKECSEPSGCLGFIPQPDSPPFLLSPLSLQMKTLLHF